MLSTSSVSIGLWWVLAALQQARGDDFQLPITVRPRHYDLAILYDLDPKTNFSFFGKVDIHLSAENSTSRLILHAEDFEIGANCINMTNIGLESVKVSETIYDGGYLTIALSQPLAQGENYTLSVAFHGNLTKKVAGAYIRSYFDKEANKTEYMVASKFRSIWARKAFPCFDEPSFKATFCISIGHSRNYSALSNMPSLATSDADANALKYVWPWGTIYETIKKSQDHFVWSHFETSPLMSTFAVAWVVSKFTHVKKDTRSASTIKIWSRPALIEQANYALDIGHKMMESYNESFGIPYPLPKLDIVAIPGAGDPASEGWGLIQNVEVVLLHDVAENMPLNKETVSHVIAHDMVHQWFSNLVTMESWMDLWLFESFATYIAALNLAAIEPEWEFEDNLAGLNMISVLNKELLELTRPYTVTSEDFDELVSFKKGYVLIRMLAKVLGEKPFREGIKNFLQLYSYKNTAQNKLWRELTLADQGNAGLTYSRSLRSITDSWTNQPGFPTLNVTREYVKGRYLSIRQMLSHWLSPSANWWVPLAVLGPNDTNISRAMEWVLVHDTTVLESEFKHSSDNVSWVVLNTDMLAPYRVNYDLRNWELLGRVLHTPNYTAIPMLSRVQLVSDALELAWNGQLNYGIALQIVTYLKRERQYLPIKVALEALFRMEVMFMRSPGYGNFLIFIQNLIKDAYNESIMGDVRSETSVERSRMQILLNKWACRVELASCQEKAVGLFQRWMNLKQENEKNPILREMRPIVYCTAIARGNMAQWEFLLYRQTSTEDTAEAGMMLRALACSEEVWILARYLEWAITPNSSVRPQDAPAVIDAVIRSKTGFMVAKEFIYNRIGDIYKAFKGQRGLIGTFLKALASQFTMQYDIDEFEGWHSHNTKYLKGSEKQVAEADAEVRKNMKWLKKYRTYVTRIIQESFPMNESQMEWRGNSNYDEYLTGEDYLREGHQHNKAHSINLDSGSLTSRTVYVIVWTFFITITRTQ